MSQLKYEKLAVIIEPRQHLCLPLVLREYDRILKHGWHFYLCVGTLNDEWMKQQAEKYLKHHTWEIKQLHVDNLCKKTYSYLLTSPQFWDELPGEHILLFQADTIPLPNSPFSPEDFFQYDYIGAPWRETIDNVWVPRGNDGQCIYVGNGGLSLRKRSSTLDICNKTPQNTIMTEDLHFCKEFYNHKQYQLAPINIAGQFSAELQLCHKHPFGLHYPFGIPEFNQLCQLYPTLLEWLQLFKSYEQQQKNRELIK